jgi:Na+-transporting methylmalonyl-CoA/oxaloacetate decarboxylase gamma subunit
MRTHALKVKAFLLFIDFQFCLLILGCFAIYLLVLLSTVVRCMGQAILTSHKIPFARRAISIW